MGKYSEASERTVVNIKSDYKDDYVYVDDSMYLQSLGIKGKGLYANRMYKKGDVIMEYKGILLTNDQANEKARFTQYLFNVKKDGKIHHVIDGANNRYASAAKYVNSVLDFRDKVRNTEFKQYDKKVYLVASKDIKRNDEFIAYYGDNTIGVINAT